METAAEHPESEQRRLEELRDAPRRGKDHAAFYGRAALEYGLRTEAMEAEWARWLVKAIDERSEE